MIQDEVISTLIDHLPDDVIHHALVPYLDRAFIIVCMLTRNDSSVIKPFLDHLGEFADGLAVLDLGSDDDTMTIVNDWYNNERQTRSFYFVCDKAPFFCYQGVGNDLIDQARTLASNHSLPLESTFICVVEDPTERICCPNVRRVKECLVEQKDCHYLIRRCYGQTQTLDRGFARLSLEFHWTGSNIDCFTQNCNAIPIADTVEIRTMS